MEKELRMAGIRANVDARSERMNQKIRQAQLEKIPCMLIVGDKEAADSTVSARLRNGEQLPPQSVQSLLDNINKAIENRDKELS